MRFDSGIQELKSLVTETKITGYWIDEGDFYEFSSDNGFRLNFWTNTISP
jgi:hypothetical protein